MWELDGWSEKISEHEQGDPLKTGSGIMWRAKAQEPFNDYIYFTLTCRIGAIVSCPRILMGYCSF